MCRSLKKRDVWWYLELFCTEFANEIVEDGLGGTRQKNGIYDFWWGKFVMKTLLCDDKKASIIIFR